MNITGKEFKKFEYLIGFVNNIVEMVSDPETDQTSNCKGSSIYSIGYEIGDKDNLKLGCLIEDVGSITEFKDNLKYIEDLLRDLLTHDNTKEWEALRS
jgi:hypothetical protein